MLFLHARLPKPVSYTMSPKCSFKSPLWQNKILTYGSFFTSQANTGNKVLYKNFRENFMFLMFEPCAASLYYLLIFIIKVKNKFYIKVEILFSFTKKNVFTFVDWRPRMTSNGRSTSHHQGCSFRSSTTI